MQQWEYMVVTVRDKEDERSVLTVDGTDVNHLPLPKMHILLSNLSEDGWELAGKTSSNNCKDEELRFKRQR